MAGKGIEIDIAANARDFQRGVKDVEKGLEEVADALDDVSRDADKTGNKLGDELSDGARDAGRSVEQLERKFKDVADASKRETRNAGDAMKTNTKDATTAAARDLGELKNEAIQNASETFSSFDGSASSFADGIQGTFGGIVSSMGPVGMAVGAAGALGIGMLIGETERAKDESAKLRAEVGELAGQLIDMRGDPAAAIAAVADRLKELATTTEEGEVNLAQLHDAAETSVSGFRRLADAYAGNTTELEKMVEVERERLEAAKDAFNQDKGWDAATTERLKNARDGQQLIVDGLEETIKITEQAEAQETAWLESNGPAYEARAERLETIQGELDSTIGSWSDYQDAETGAIDPAAFIEGMAAKRESIANFNQNVQTISQTFGLSAEETQAILDQGLDFAPHLQSIMDSGMAGAYAEEVRAAIGGGQSIIDGTPLTSTVTAQPDTADAQQQLDQTAQDRNTEIEAEASTTTAARQLDSLAEKKRTATILAGVDLAAAERALTEFVNRKRTATVTVNSVDREGRPVP